MAGGIRPEEDLSFTLLSIIHQQLIRKSDYFGTDVTNQLSVPTQSLKEYQITTS